METFLEFLRGFDIQTILSIVGAMWYFSRHIDAKMDAKIDKHIAVIDQNIARIDQNIARIDQQIIQQASRTDQNIARIDQQIAQQASRTDRLYEMFIDLVKQLKS